jgi:hypothetical protein
LWIGAPGRIADLLSQLDGKIEDAERQAQYFFARGLESTLRGLLPEAKTYPELSQNYRARRETIRLVKRNEES